MLTGQPNQSWLGHVSYLTVQNIENTLKNFPIESKILPCIHKKVLLKSINVLIAKSITLVRVRFTFPQAVGSDCILLNMTLEMHGCQ